MDNQQSGQPPSLFLIAPYATFLIIQPLKTFESIVRQIISALTRPVWISDGFRGIRLAKNKTMQGRSHQTPLALAADLQRPTQDNALHGGGGLMVRHIKAKAQCFGIAPSSGVMNHCIDHARAFAEEAKMRRGKHLEYELQAYLEAWTNSTLAIWLTSCSHCTRGNARFS
jgi:hypothetical protein